ncbi:uncharacterized protein isoform X2 [Rhodnius prolixus]|uniref:uncharacterized protein isoform X2 n=1 Tax=Rhodnius prolixus TaxID=13249 RepID=UPI003D18B2C9
MSYYKGSGYGGSRGGYRGGSSSYRGGGGVDSSWRGGRGGSSFSSSRAVSSSSGGGGGSSRYYPSSPPSSSYESRSRSSYVGSNSATERYSSRREDSYNRYPEMSSYSSREYGRGSSPEPPRKRVRGDSPSYIGGRRSHDRTFSASSGADYPSSRVGGGSGSFYDKSNSGGGALGGGYLSEKGTYREVRESRPPHHAPPSSNDYPTFRKPSFSSPRGGGGGFRASRRGLRSSRGAGAAFRHSSSASYLSRKRLLADSAYHLRRRGLTTRTSYLRRLKQYRLLKRYSGRTSERKKRDSDDNQDGDEEDDKDAEEGDEEDEEIIEVETSEEGEEEEEEEEDEEEDEGEEKKASDGAESKELEISKEPVEFEEGEVEGGEDEGGEKAADDEGAAEDGEDKEGKEKNEKESTKDDPATSPKKVIKKKKKVMVKKTVKKSKTKTVSSESKEAKKNEDGKEESGGEDKEDSEQKTTLTNFLGQPYIKLKCPHCHFACVTFKEYSRHLGSTKHLTAMSTLSIKLRKTFATMRLEQRKMQKVLDEEAKSLNMRLRTVFCNVCKLNYRTLKSQHQNSASHKKMREFQAPYCRVCRVGYKSSWAYEVHLCELQHIKRKARMERLSKPPGAKDLDEDINLDTNNFMVLDAVGSGDDSEVEKSDNEAAEDKTDEVKEKSKDGSKEKKKEKKEIKLGSEFCKLMEVYFCELCKIYLPRLDDKERALTVHCRSRTHLQRYIRSRDDRNLRRKAVKLHKEREKLREKEKKTTSKDESSVKDDTEDSAGIKAEEKEEDKSVTEASTKKEAEDKSWSAEEEDGMKNLDDDDDEESKEGERYDRFKHSDKEGGATNPGNANANNDEGSPESPVEEKQTVAKGKGGSATKDTSAAAAENTANGNITSAEKKKIEAAE